MSLSKALIFYNLFRKDMNFRRACFACQSEKELSELLKEECLPFSDEEFGDIISSSLFKCQTEEEALAVRQIEQAYYLLLGKCRRGSGE